MRASVDAGAAADRGRTHVTPIGKPIREREVRPDVMPVPAPRRIEAIPDRLPPEIAPVREPERVPA